MTSKKYQQDADIIRLKHLKYYGDLIEEYHEKTGKYPLQGLTHLENYVKIANARQFKYTKGGPPYEHKVSSVDEFRTELENGLSRKIKLKYDPQFVPVTAPNFYIYMIKNDTYYFAVHLFEPKSFTKQVSPNYNKVELTNSSGQYKGLWEYKKLMNNNDFISAISSTVSKESFFINLENQYN